MKRKNIIAVTLCTAIIFSLVACQGKREKTEMVVQTQVESESEMTQIPNPWTDCTTIKEAEAKTGFEITVPDQLNGYEEKDISVMEKDGTDISGDYREADTFEKVKLGGRG